MEYVHMKFSKHRNLRNSENTHCDSAACKLTPNIKFLLDHSNAEHIAHSASPYCQHIESVIDCIRILYANDHINVDNSDEIIQHIKHVARFSPPPKRGACWQTMERHIHHNYMCKRDSMTQPWYASTPKSSSNSSFWEQTNSTLSNSPTNESNSSSYERTNSTLSNSTLANSPTNDDLDNKSFQQFYNSSAFQGMSPTMSPLSANCQDAGECSRAANVVEMSGCKQINWSIE